MEKIDTDTGNDELEKFKLNFARCANREVAPLIITSWRLPDVRNGNLCNLQIQCGIDLLSCIEQRVKFIVSSTWMFTHFLLLMSSKVTLLKTGDNSTSLSASDYRVRLVLNGAMKCVMKILKKRNSKIVESNGVSFQRLTAWYRNDVSFWSWPISC